MGCVYLIIKMKLCSLSGYKIHHGRGSTLVKADGKTFVFHTSKARRAHGLKRSPREVKWTILYRRKHRKGMEEEAQKKRSRRTKTYQKAIEGATLTEILAKKTMKPEVRKAQREQAIRTLKEKNKVPVGGKKPAPAAAGKKDKAAPKKPQGSQAKIAKPMPKTT